MRLTIAIKANTGNDEHQFLIAKSIALNKYFIMHLHHVNIYLFYMAEKFLPIYEIIKKTFANFYASFTEVSIFMTL